MKSAHLFRSLYHLLAKRTPRVLLLLQQGEEIHAFAARGSVLSPLPPLAEATPFDENTGEKYDEVRLCLAASNVFFRVWTFPFRSRAKIRQALHLLMGSELPFEPETLEHALLFQPCEMKTTVVLSASVHKARLSALLGKLHGYGIEPDCITVDPFPFISCLSNGHQEGHQVHCLMREDYSLLLYLNGRTAQATQMLQTGWKALCPECEGNTFVATVHTKGFCSALEGTHRTLDGAQARRVFTKLHEEALRLFLQYAEGAEPEMQLHCELFADPRTASLLSEACEPFVQKGIHLALPYATESEAALLHCGKHPAVFPAPKKRHAFSLGGAWQWKVGVACALVLASVLLSLLAEGVFLDRRTRVLETETAALFQRTLPELGGRKWGVVQMESILRQRGQVQTTQNAAKEKGASVVKLFSAVHEALDVSFPVRFNTFRLSRTVASLSGTTDGYETVNRIRDTLAGLPEITSVRLINAGAGTGGRLGANDARNIVFELELVVK